MQTNHPQSGKLNEMLPIEALKTRGELAMRREKALLNGVRYVR